MKKQKEWKKYQYIIVIIPILLASFFFFPKEVLAVTTEYKSIAEELVVVSDDINVSFPRLYYQNLSATEDKTIGISGLIYNANPYEVTVFSTTTYYDKNYNLLATTTKNQVAAAGVYTTYTDMISINKIKKGYTANDIAYYKIDIQVNDSSLITPSKNAIYYDSDYTIDSYHIDMVVNENNTFDITETITAHFNVEKHGIFRTLPLRNDVVRTDGTKSTNRTEVSKVKVNEKYTTSTSNGQYKIRIGSADTVLTGDQTYVIKYRYNLGEDPLPDKDELYYNLIGTEWDTAIGNFSFTITMPKTFDATELGFSAGTRGSVENEKITYHVYENKIIGNYNGILQEYNGLTIRTELPEGYFVGASLTVDPIIYIMCFIPFFFLVVSIFFWYFFGRDEEVVPTVEFYPPEGINSLTAAFIYKGDVTNRDITSLLIYLANQGYIQITETKRSKFKITKLKDYDGDNYSERLFLTGLFKKKKKISGLLTRKSNEDEEEQLEEVTSNDLYNSFYLTMEDIQKEETSIKNKSKIFTLDSFSKNKYIYLMIAITFCIITIPPVLSHGEKETVFPAIIFSGVGFSIFFITLFGAVPRFKYSTKLEKFGWCCFGLVFADFPFTFMVVPALIVDYMYLIGYCVGFCCIIGMIICLKFLPKRTPYGNKMLGKIQGFKTFLETAEKDKLEALVSQNPTYFYDILPYTYALGVSDKWIKKFEVISLEAPKWYDGTDDFTTASFTSFMERTMDSAEASMSSSPSSSSSSSGGGGSSGGGSSGGGSGGGGGGSW